MAMQLVPSTFLQNLYEQISIHLNQIEPALAFPLFQTLLGRVFQFWNAGAVNSDFFFGLCLRLLKFLA